jgi:hypothetical protein
VEDTPKTWFQLTGSGRSHDGTVLASADPAPEGPAGAGTVDANQSESGLRESAFLTRS